MVSETVFFYNKVLYNYNSKKKLERFVLKKLPLKNGFLIVLKKCDLTGVGLFFWRKNKSEKVKNPKICLSFGGSMP